MTIIHKFRILHDGWEMDNEGWVERDDASGDISMHTTNHGGRCTLSGEDALSYIAEVEHSIAGTKEALKIMGLI